jgi:hypothetical protein
MHECQASKPGQISLRSVAGNEGLGIAIVFTAPRMRKPNHCVQATPDCALLFIVAQVSGAPDAERYVSDA